MPSLTERVRRCCTGAVHDVLRSLGHDYFVLPPSVGMAQGLRAGVPR